MRLKIDLSEFDALVFAGGGGRCIWQAGFTKVLLDSGNLKINQIAAVSAGATIASIVFAGKAEEGLAYFKSATQRNPKNFYPENLFRNEPVFPQYKIYYQAIHDLFDSATLQKLKDGPPIKAMITLPPSILGSYFGTLLGFMLYLVEKKIRNPIHPTFSKMFGYKSIAPLVNDCNNVKELADLLIQSSCTPPFVPVKKRNGIPALDGGIVDNVPADAISGN